MAKDEPRDLKVVSIWAANVSKACMVCGRNVRTARPRLPLCVLCRNTGLRTTDDLCDLEEQWQLKTQSSKS